MQAECELPDYVNWGKKTKVGCIFLRSGVNIVPRISRTLAIYEIDPPTFQEGAASGQSTLARLPGWLRAKYIGETGILPALIQKGLCLQNLSEYIDSILGANHFLETRFIPEWEQRFTVSPRNARNAHRPLGREQHLEEILSVRVARKVAEDHTVSWDRNRWGVLREEICAGLRGAAVEIERRLDGSHWLRYRGSYLHLRACPEPLPRSASPSGLRPPGLAEQKPKPPNQIKPKYHVPADHPWKRKPWKRAFLLGRKPDISTLR